MRLPALLVALALIEPHGPAGEDVASLESTLRAFRVERPHLWAFDSDPDEAFVRLATRCRDEGWNADRLTHEAGRELDLPPAVAVLLVDGYLTREIARAQRSNPGAPPTAPSEVRGIRSLYEKANARLPGSETVLAAAIATYGALLGFDAMPDAADAFWLLARTAPDPPSASLAALRRARVFDVRLTAPVLARFSAGIRSLPALRDLAEVTLRPSPVSTAAFGAAAERLRSLPETDLRIRSDVAGGEIQGLLDRGLAREAMARWGALDEAVRAEILRGEEASFEVPADGGVYRGRTRDLRRELAAADAAAPGPDGPRLLPPPDDDDPLTPLVRALARTDPPPDPFGLFRDRNPTARDHLPRLLADRLETRFARTFGYPEIAEQVEEASRRYRRLFALRPRPLTEIPLPPAVSSRLAALATLEAQEMPRERPNSDPFDASAASAIAKSLARPLLVPFRVVPKPESGSLAAPLREDHPPRPPSGFGIVRCERVGLELVAVALSHAVDPSGESSGGGYWLLRAGPGALAWGEPVYTGLRQYRPYVVRTTSSIPLTDGKTVRLEVNVQEPDETRLPPFQVFRRGAEGLVLESTWSELQRDSDGDGVPDLVEERLLTSPDDPDTDADGQSDAVDPLPHVAFRAPTDPVMSSAVGAIVAHLLVQGRFPAPRPSSPGAEGVLKGAFGSRSLPVQTLFIVAPRTLFLGCGFPVRVVVVTDEEWRAVEAKFGRGSPTRLELFALDHGRSRGIVRWNGGWQWGTLNLERVDGRWKVVVGSLTMT
jgi:hypothetical protein